MSMSAHPALVLNADFRPMSCGATIKMRDSVNQDENAPGVG